MYTSRLKLCRDMPEDVNGALLILLRLLLLMLISMLRDNTKQFYWLRRSCYYFYSLCTRVVHACVPVTCVPR